MTDDIIRKYTPEETAKLRDDYIKTIVLPVVQDQFDRVKEFKSAVLFVSQYHDDEAGDAIHGKLAYSISGHPDIKKYMTPRSPERLELLLDGRPAFDLLSETNGDNLVEFLRTARDNEFSNWDNQVRDAKANNISIWDSNRETVPLFAAFCKEGGQQFARICYFHNPIIIIRRRPNSTELEFDYISEMIRPWLDGVMSDFEAQGI